MLKTNIPCCAQEKHEDEERTARQMYSSALLGALRSFRAEADDLRPGGWLFCLLWLRFMITVEANAHAAGTVSCLRCCLIVLQRA